MWNSCVSLNDLVVFKGGIDLFAIKHDRKFARMTLFLWTFIPSSLLIHSLFIHYIVC
jgi:hypothetical protein